MGRDEDELVRRSRQMENLLGDLEPLIPFFETKTITDVYVYGDGRVQISDFQRGTYDAGISLAPIQRMRIINSLASACDAPIDKWARPTLESIIPKYNIRTTAIIAPWLASPEIVFRRPSDKVHALEEYLAEGRVSQELYGKIISHIEKRSNIVISGATGSGKTTFTNACIDKMYELTPNERIYIVEDTPELQCRSPNKTQLYIRKDQAVAAIQTALRWTPQRIIFGEIRSGEVAVELLEAWNTGHPGNVTTIHANSAASTIPRIEGLLRQVIKGQLPDLAESIGLLVHLKSKSVAEALTIREIQEAKK
jgi:type IV secretion system protein VirB11